MSGSNMKIIKILEISTWPNPVGDLPLPNVVSLQLWKTNEESQMHQIQEKRRTDRVNLSDG